MKLPGRGLPTIVASRGTGPVVASAVAMTLAAGVASAATWSRPAQHPDAHRGHADAATTAEVSQRNPSVSPLSAGAPAGAFTLSVEPARASAPVQATVALISALSTNGIPPVALNAYRVAAARLGTALPGCGIQWSLIAAIGRVESDHGRYGGASLQPDGTSTPPIIGPALNGAGFAYIHDTDHGVLDGDPVTDRAVGPMQFIPSTWAGYALDGNADGTASVFDINDAALAAAHYLCVAGGDLRTAAGQRRAVLAYNHSDAYLAEVLALAHSYATGVPVTGPLTGSTTDPVPPPSGDPYAPAAPGPARAAYPTRPAGTARKPAATKPAPGSTTRQPPAGSGTAPTAPAAPAAPAPRPTSQPAAGAPLPVKTSVPAPLPTLPQVPAPSPTATLLPCLPLQPLCH